MKGFWSRLSISYKIFFTVLLFMLMIQSMTIAYLWKFESKILIAKEKQVLKKELQSESKKLTEHLIFLAKETRFLASLEMMDDLIGQDIDKRIVTLLQRRADDLGENIIIVAMTNSTFVASSQKGFISKNLQHLNQKLQQDFLYFNAPVFSSFDKNKHLGTIVMLYPFANLTRLEMDNPDKTLWLTPPTPLSLFKMVVPEKSIHLTQKLSGILKDWKLHLAFSKDKALMTLKDIQNILFITFLFSIFLLGGVIFILTRKLTSPINHLSKGFTEIVETKDYSKQVAVTSEDEIGELSKAFNLLTFKTKNLLEEIGEQNRLHRGQLESLIAFFNALIQTQTEKEAIEVAEVHLKMLLGIDEVCFEKTMVAKNLFSIDIYDFQIKRHKNIGYFVIKGDNDLIPQKHFYHSIAQMIQQQLEHIQLRDATQKALEAKSTFLSVISHDLRTPLGSILNLTQHMMVKQDMEDEELSMLRHIEMSAEHLLGMINNILQLSKLESNSIMIDKKEIDLDLLLEEILDIVAPLIAEKGLILHKEFLAKKHHIVSDANIIKQICINLLSNAIKFTNKGDIFVRLYEQGDLFFFVVEDSGIGIDVQKQHHLFQPFYQASTNAKGFEHSSGLGLALSQKMAYLIGGSIDIDSEGLDKGTTASLSIKSF